MPIVGNRYYNDPMIGQAFANLASAFGPPSAQDTLAYTTARAKREEAQRLAEFFNLSKDPNANQTMFDRMGMATGQWTPSQSFYSVDLGNQTQRYGIDTSAATSRANNAADNARALQTNAADNQRAMAQAALQQQGSIVGTMFGPLNQGQVRPTVPSAIANMFGLPEMPSVRGNISMSPGETVVTPDGQTFSGTQKPLSLDETKALIMGQLPPEQQRAMVASDLPVEAIIGPQGTPQIVARSDAIGQQPFVNKGAEARPETANYNAPNGQTGTAVFDPAQRVWIDTQTKMPLPPRSITYSAGLQGGSADTGLGKPVQNMIDQKLLDATMAKQTATQLRAIIQASPASQGAVGWLRGTAQNALQMGGEVGAYFGGPVQEIQKRIANGFEDASLAGAFDPRIPTVEMLSNVLAFQYAKMMTGERLSNEMLRASRAALGLESLTANQMDATARLNAAIQMIEQQEGVLRATRQQDSVPAQVGDPGAAAVPSVMPNAQAPGGPMVIQTPKGAVTIQRVQ